MTLRRAVLCDLDITAGANPTFGFDPLAGQLEAALQDELDNIGAMLDKTLGCPVYFGSP